jgi:hypothetical protein
MVKRDLTQEEKSKSNLKLLFLSGLGKYIKSEYTNWSVQIALNNKYITFEEYDKEIFTMIYDKDTKPINACLSIRPYKDERPMSMNLRRKELSYRIDYFWQMNVVTISGLLTPILKYEFRFADQTMIADEMRWNFKEIHRAVTKNIVELEKELPEELSSAYIGTHENRYFFDEFLLEAWVWEISRCMIYKLRSHILGIK